MKVSTEASLGQLLWKHLLSSGLKSDENNLFVCRELIAHKTRESYLES